MKSHPDLIHPVHCFCQFADSELYYWAGRRYIDGISTLELLDSTDDPREKEIISIVAMLDLEEETVLELMGGVDKPTHHIVHCWETMKRMLSQRTDPSELASKS